MDDSMLADAVQQSLAGECTPERVRRVERGEHDNAQALWREVLESGFADALVPEARAARGWDSWPTPVVWPRRPVAMCVAAAGADHGAARGVRPPPASSCPRAVMTIAVQGPPYMRTAPSWRAACHRPDGTVGAGGSRR